MPSPAVRRLSLYLRQLEALQADRVATVSSYQLAQSLGLTDTQIRKDLAYLGPFGRPGVGYAVMPLIQHLRRIFSTDHISPILLVGADNLGKAVTAYQNFRAKGFALVAVFDNDPQKIGRRVAQLPVQPMTDLPQTAHRYRARLAIIAVPATRAQDVADQLITVGVRGILNFAPIRLDTPPCVTVRNIDIATELEQLNFQTHTKSPEIFDPKEFSMVDDSEESVAFLSQIAEDNGHRFRVSQNGKEAALVMKEHRSDLSCPTS